MSPASNMPSLGAVSAALHASLLVLLAQGIHRSRDGVYVRPQHRLTVMDRTSVHHLPTYMVHLYRNFRSNFSSPMDTTEPRNADTVKSLMAKSKSCFLNFILCLSKNARGHTREFTRLPGNGRFDSAYS